MEIDCNQIVCGLLFEFVEMIERGKGEFEEVHDIGLH